MPFEYLDHTADIRIHAWGKDYFEAFQESVKAMFGVMLIDPSKVEQKEERTIELKGPDLEILFVDFLTEFLILFDTEMFLVSDIDIKNLKFQIDEENNADSSSDDQCYIKAVAKGEIFDPKKHQVDTEVKAVTFSYLEIYEEHDSNNNLKEAHIKFVLDL
ncbi:MAG: archease [Promethearchaeota archaeon]